jgi:hypothetical protein
MTSFRQAFAAWLGLLAAMTANGIFREAFLLPRFGEHRAHQISSVLGASIVLTLAGIFVRHLGDPASAPLARIGLFWGALTLIFEFGFGHYVSGVPWPELLRDYDVRAGHLWPLVLVTTVAAPSLWGAALDPRPAASMEGSHT